MREFSMAAIACVGPYKRTSSEAQKRIDAGVQWLSSHLALLPGLPNGRSAANRFAHWRHYEFGHWNRATKLGMSSAV